jgi:hypothetical protein
VVYAIGNLRTLTMNPFTSKGADLRDPWADVSRKDLDRTGRWRGPIRPIFSKDSETGRRFWAHAVTSLPRMSCASASQWKSALDPFSAGCPPRWA